MGEATHRWISIPNPEKKAQFDSKKSSLLFKLTPKKFHLYLQDKEKSKYMMPET